MTDFVNIKAVTRTNSGEIIARPARVKAIYFVDTVNAGSVVLKDGGASGTTVLDLRTPASAAAWEYLELPGNGILFSTDIYVVITDVSSVTVLFE